MANGTRNAGIVNTPTDLTFQHMKLNDSGVFINYSANSVSKVEIYPTEADADAGTNIIETITSGNITEISTGLYSYTIAALSSTGKYFDKIYLIPDAGVSEKTFTNPFHIVINKYNGYAPGIKEKCRVYLNLSDIIDNPLEGDKVSVSMNVKEAWYGNEFVKGEEETFRADSEGNILGLDGQIGMLLIETDTLTADTFPDGDDTVYYNFNIADRLYEKRTVTQGLLQAQYKDLPLVEE